MLEISQDASKHLVELLAERGGDGLRISVERGGCAGLQYVMSLDSQREGDQIFKCRGACVFIDADSASYVDGSTLEYDEGLSGAGFRIQNPHASRSCGCGTSFELNSQESPPRPSN